jgi:uncharacterized protein (TIGR00251 family)
MVARTLTYMSYEIDVRVIPRAKRDEVAGERGGRLLVRTSAPPVDNKANDAVRRIIAEHLGVAARDVEVVTGHRSRDKTLRISAERTDTRGAGRD